VLGLDDDTPRVFQETVNFLISNNIDMLQVTISTPFPGTPLYYEMKECPNGAIRSSCVSDKPLI
jgi:radical SAM superfamily enzyme YgiQ (UPF0313 family)